MMKYFSYIMIILSLIFPANGQERQPDSTRETISKNHVNTFSGRSQRSFSISLPLSLEDISKSHDNLLIPYSIIPLQSIMLKEEENDELYSIWKQEVSRQEEYRTILTVIKSIEGFSIADFSYHDFKKHGF